MALRCAQCDHLQPPYNVNFCEQCSAPLAEMKKPGKLNPSGSAASLAAYDVQETMLEPVPTALREAYRKVQQGTKDERTFEQERSFRERGGLEPATGLLTVDDLVEPDFSSEPSLDELYYGEADADVPATMLSSPSHEILSAQGLTRQGLPSGRRGAPPSKGVIAPQQEPPAQASTNEKTAEHQVVEEAGAMEVPAVSSMRGTPPSSKVPTLLLEKHPLDATGSWRRETFIVDESQSELPAHRDEASVGTQSSKPWLKLLLWIVLLACLCLLAGFGIGLFFHTPEALPPERSIPSRLAR